MHEEKDAKSQRDPLRQVIDQVSHVIDAKPPTIRFCVFGTVLIHNFGEAKDSLLGRLGLFSCVTLERK